MKKFALAVVAVTRLKKIMERKKVVIKQEQQDEIKVRSRRRRVQRSLTRGLQDLIETFTDVGRAWLKKIVRTVVTSAATEAGLNLVIEPPSDKKILFVSVGVSEKEVKDRMMKLKVRAKAVVDALLAASKNPQLAPPKPLCSFLQRISSDGVYYPAASDVNGVTQPKFLWPEEEQVQFLLQFCFSFVSVLFQSCFSLLLATAQRQRHRYSRISRPLNRDAGPSLECRRTSHRHPAVSERTHDFKHHVRALFGHVHRARTLGSRCRTSLCPEQAVRCQLQAHCLPADARVQHGAVDCDGHCSGAASARDGCRRPVAGHRRGLSSHVTILRRRVDAAAAVEH
jgi:hypothetical protein